MTTLRTALVGCGKVGSIHARILHDLPESHFVSVCDASPDRAQSFAVHHGTRAYTNLDTLLAESRPEFLVIATPHPVHAEAAIKAARAGVHVLVEKPMAARLEDADAMVEAARQAGTFLNVVSQRRFCEPVLRMHDAIVRGKIGTPALGVVLMFNWRDESYYRSDPWRGRWDTEGGGVLVNQAPHHLDLLQWFMGPVQEISGFWANLNHPFIEVEDSAVASVRFKNGGLGAIVVSLSQNPGIHSKVHIHGSNGASIGVETDRGATFVAGVNSVAEPPINDLWTIPGEEHKLPEFQARDRDSFGERDTVTHYHTMQITDLLRAIILSRSPPGSEDLLGFYPQSLRPLVSRDEGRTVVAMSDAIYRSNREHRSVSL